MIQHNYEKIIIFEDDIRFEPFFKKKLKEVMEEMRKYQNNWDLV